LLKAAKKKCPSPNVFAFDWPSNEEPNKEVKKLLTFSSTDLEQKQHDVLKLESTENES